MKVIKIKASCGGKKRGCAIQYDLPTMIKAA
jgi:hypothetical protein